MIHKKLSTFTFIAAIIFLAMLIPGCASRRIHRPPPYISSKPQPHPQKNPARTRIPATQKPYRVGGKTYYPIPSSYGYSQIGIASWYGKKFHGRKTSNGETYDMYESTAAHKTLPMNTHLLVENLENGRKAIVRINDRGPFVKNRIIDMTYTGAKKLGMLKNGTARIRITALGEAVLPARGKSARFLPYQDFKRGDFFVQVGAFSKKANANRLKKNLRAQGYRAVSPFYKTNSGSYYRVQVRAGHTLKAAHKIERRLEQHFPAAFVIAK